MCDTSLLIPNVFLSLFFVLVKSGAKLIKSLMLLYYVVSIIRYLVLKILKIEPK